MVVAVDSSTFIAYLGGAQGRDIDLLVAGLQDGELVLPPAALVEILSDIELPAHHRSAVQNIELLELTPDYWQRAAASRALVLSRKLRARLPDTLIAQSCIDHDVALITRDGDFRHFAKHCGLRLA
jgi:predicted nucleic acid-binding protein